jgi:hypothetical protein
MYITPTMFVWGFWIVGLLGAALILGMFIMNATQGLPGDALSWRLVKLVSSGAGVIGFFLLLLNFEQVVRSSVVTEAKEYELGSFLTAKFASAGAMLSACSRPKDTIEAQRTCSDLQGIDTSVSFTSFMSGKKLGELQTANRTYEGAIVANQVNSYFKSIDHSRYVFGDPGMFSFETRLLIALISLIFVLVGLGGGLGEALYQYRQEKLKSTAPSGTDQAAPLPPCDGPRERSTEGCS